MAIKISEQRTNEGYKITFFTDNKSIFRKARILLNELLSKERKRNMVCETDSEFDPILEMIESGKGIPPITGS